MSKDYDVGYGKPPKATRFQKGRSGNPAGRPGGSRNLRTDVAQESSSRIRIREEGRSRTVSKQQAMVKKLYNDALKGDTRAISLLLNLIFKVLPEDNEADSSAAPQPLKDCEREILAAYDESIRHQVRQEMTASDTGHTSGQAPDGAGGDDDATD